MANPKKLTIGAVNLAMEPPHSPERYVRAFEFLASAEVPPIGKYHGDTHIAVASASVNPRTGCVHGNLAKFVLIDSSRPWFNLINREPVVDAEGNPVAISPPGMGPNHEDIPFIFFPTSHHLYFDTHGKKVTPNGVSNALFGIFNSPQMFEDYGRVHTTPVQAKDAIERVLAISVVQRIDVVWTRPNPDVPTDDEREILERLDELNAGKVQQSVFSRAHESINVDEKLRALMTIGRRNGYTRARGQDEAGKPVTRSTRDYPRFVSVPYRRRDGYWATLEDGAIGYNTSLVLG